MSTTVFKGIQHYGYANLNEQLEDNFTSWLQYNFLKIGAFNNIRMSSSGAYGGNYSNLRAVKDPRYTNGRVWEANRGDWVWESGIDYSTQPISISGIWVNNSFQSAASGYIIDYPRGRIIFNTAISTSSTVVCEHSQRYISAGKASLPWAKNILLNAYRVDLPDYALFGSGMWNTLAENRITLPAIVVESFPSRRYDKYQLGGGHIVYQDLVFHIFTETPFDRNQIVDCLSNQIESEVWLYDRNLVAAANRYPLKYDGTLLNATYNYPYLINNYFYNKSVITDVSVSQIPSPGVFNAAVRYTLEVIREDI